MDSMPRPVRVARALMFAVAGLTGLTAVGYVLANGLSMTTFGYVMWAVWPGVVSLLLALQLGGGGARPDRWIIVLQIVCVVLSLARIGDGDPRGIVNLILPIAILILVTRRSARAYFRDETPAFAY